MLERLLVIETSGKIGHVGLATGTQVLAERTLNEARRHARDLASYCRELLAGQNWKPTDLTAVVICQGPGSFTGLRVGLASAKTLAYALGCPLLAVPTFDAIVEAMHETTGTIDVVADALQGMIYTARYSRSVGDWEHVEPLQIRLMRDWAATLDAATTVTGPGSVLVQAVLPDGVAVAPPERHHATLAGLTRCAVRHPERYRADPWYVEPIYLRGSSAEEKRKLNPV